ncbi:MAG TPA: hypothetical protein VJ123_04545 [Anaerolineales bacterium]|nr:hypothetical protein [Anaerolineales bacterium]
MGRAACLAALVLAACLPKPTPSAPPAPPSARTPTSPPAPAAAPSPLPREAAIPASAAKFGPETDPYPPVLHAAGWEQPIPLPGPINTAGAEDSPFITPDGATLYFFFTPDASVPPEQQLFDGVTGIYVSHRQGDSWQAPERVILQDPGKLTLDGCAFVLGDVMWFCSAREGYRGIRLFTARFIDSRWQGWADAGDLLNLTYETGEMHISADGSELYFHSARAGGLGDLDLWVSRWDGAAWGLPENVAAVNSPAAEGWPFVSQDGHEFWFTRTYLGAPAIFRSQKVDGGWGEPELILSHFAGEPTLDLAGDLYFVHHFVQDGRILEADIYIAYRKH